MHEKVKEPTLQEAVKAVVECRKALGYGSNYQDLLVEVDELNAALEREPQIPIPPAHQRAAEQFDKMFTAVPLTEAEKLPDPELEREPEPTNDSSARHVHTYMCYEMGLAQTADRPMCGLKSKDDALPSPSDLALVELIQHRMDCGFLALCKRLMGRE